MFNHGVGKRRGRGEGVLPSCLREGYLPPSSPTSSPFEAGTVEGISIGETDLLRNEIWNSKNY